MRKSGELSADRSLYHLREQLEHGRDGIAVIRVLHERMEPLHHLTRGLP